MKKFNLLWLATKQLRLSFWLYDKLFALGYYIHVWKKYHKFDPSVAEIFQKQYPSLKLSLAKADHWTTQSVRDGDVIMATSEPMPMRNRIQYGLGIAQDLVEGKMDHDQALFDQYFSQLQAEFKKIEKEVK